MNQRPIKPISIESVALKKGKPDKRFIDAEVIDDLGPTRMCFYTRTSRRVFTRWRFPLEPGCHITCGDKSYIVLTILPYPGSILFEACEIPTIEKDVHELLLHSLL